MAEIWLQDLGFTTRHTRSPVGLDLELRGILCLAKNPWDVDDFPNITVELVAAELSKDIGPGNKIFGRS